MATGSAIEWTQATWNPTTGCDRISKGCDNCYALTLAKRLKAMGQPRYQSDGDPRTSGPGFAVVSHPDALHLPYSWKKSKLIFVNSMSDLFHPRVPLEFVRQVFEVMASTPQHTYQVLTKRARRMRRIAPLLQWSSNVWVGVSIEDESVAHRIEDLRNTPAVVKFLSCEPLLDSIAKVSFSGIDWVIAGGESGPRSRPLNVDWVREIRDQCVGSEIPFFFKQWGGRTPKMGGRELDGRTWDEMPRVVDAHHGKLTVTPTGN